MGEANRSWCCRILIAKLGFLFFFEAFVCSYSNNFGGLVVICLMMETMTRLKNLSLVCGTGNSLVFYEVSSSLPGHTQMSLCVEPEAFV